MATITLGGNSVTTSGNLPEIGSTAKDFNLVGIDLANKTLSDFPETNLVLNIFPSVDTGVCSAAVRAFNKVASEVENTKVLCISRDLPFRQDQFCAAEGLENVIMLSDFKTAEFGKSYGLLMTNGAFDGLLSRCVIVLNKKGTVLYTEQVPEIGQEPNYEAVLKAVHSIK
jgi:thiol peroxidase